jgi:hypothetical protein
MAIRTIQQLLDKFGPGDSPRSADYVDLIETLADDRNAVYFSVTAPEDTAANPLWFDTANGSLFVYSGTAWVESSGGGGASITVSDAAPLDAEEGALWYNSSTAKAYIYYDSFWVELSPSVAGLQGMQGEQGIQGEQGVSGESGVISVIAPITNTGTSTEANIGIDLSSYYTSSQVDSAIAAVVDAAPGTLNTLNELAAAINDDASFASTVTTALGSKAPIDSPTFTGTVSGITKSMVGLPNVDNTADTEKPVSTAQQTALNLKANLSGPTFTGTTTINAIADATTTTASRGAGYMGVPQSAAATTGSYTIVGADAGEHIYSTATRTVTIPANASVAFPVGTAITFIAAAGATVTIAITTDTLLLAGAGTTGPRTLAPFGMATAIKITSTSWIISGNGLR